MRIARTRLLQQVKLLNYKFMTAVAVLSLLAQPMYGAVAQQVASATSVGDVLITAAMPKPTPGNPEYIIVKNVSASPVNLNGWKIDNHTITASNSLVANSSATICSNGSQGTTACTAGYGVSTTGLNNDGDTVKLYDNSNNQIDQISYTSAQVTTGQEIQFYNTVVPAITNVDAYYAAGTGYTGIGVDFTTKNVTTATDVELRVNRDSGDPVSIHAEQVLLDAINNSTTELYTTSGTVIVTGSRTSSSGSWPTMTGTWVGSSRPVSVEVFVTLQDSTVLNLSDNTIVDNGGNTQATVFASVPAATPPVCGASTFDNGFALGSINGQNGWSSTGAFDQEIVDNTYGIDSFGCKTFRISNAVTSGGFGNQTFSSPAVNGLAGEDASNDHFEAQFDIASTKTSQQNGLALSVSPDRGDGARMSYLSFVDTPGGIDVAFYDVQGENVGFQVADFVPTTVATGLSRNQAHTIKFVMDFVDGPSNDVVEIYIDGALVHTGTSWENYYRFDTESQGNPHDTSLENKSRSVDSLLFRAGGTAVPANLGNGFLFDNVNISTSQNIPPDTAAPSVSDVVLNGQSVSVARDYNCGPTDFNLVSGKINLSANITDISGVESAKYKIRKVTTGGCTQAGVYNSSQVNMNNQTGDSWVTLAGSELDTKDVPSDGSYTIQMTVTDNVGNIATQYIDITVDNTLPTAPSIIKPTARQWFKTTPIAASWSTASDTNGIDRYQIAYHYDDNHTFANSTCDGESINGVTLSGCRDTTSTSRNHSPASWEEGGVTIWVRAIDNAGNVGSWSKSVHYYYDHSTPITTMTTPTGVVGNSFTISGDAADNLALNRVYLQLNKSTGGRFGGVTLHMITNPLSLTNNWSHVYDANALGLTDGEYRAHASVTDMAGNSSNTGWSSYFTVDTTKPVVEITSPTVHLSNGDVEVRATVTDANLRHYWFQIKKNGTVIKSKTVLSSGIDNKLLQTLTEEGTYTITVAARDLAGGTATSGNRSADVVKTVTIDKSAPTVLLDDLGQFVNGDVEITGVANDNFNLSHYNLSLYNGTVDLSDGEVHSGDRINGDVNWGVGTVNVLGDSANISRMLDTTKLADGYYQIRLAARDEAENRDTSGVNGDPYSVHVIGFTVDNSAPVVDFPTYTTLGNVITPNTVVTDTNDPLTYNWTGSSPSVTLSATDVAAPEFTVVADGTYTFTLRVTDPAGNWSETDFTFTYEAPVTPIFPLTPTITPIGETPTTGDGFTNVGFTEGDNSSVLGTEIQAGDDAVGEKKDDEKSATSILGTTAAPNVENTGLLFGINWYWWAPILVALAGFIWRMIALMRRRQAEDV